MPTSYLTNHKISASQLSTWIKSPSEYIKQYIEDRPFIGNKYTRFGTLIHEKIEKDDSSTDHILKLKNREFYFERQNGKYILNGYLDSYDVGHIIDYKVSKKGKWSQKLVDEQIQIKFYGLWHFLEHKTLPKVSIIHIESAENEWGDLYLTGNQTQYTRQITKEDIKYIKNQIKEFIFWCNNYRRLHKC